MDNVLTYILELNGNIDKKLKEIGIANDRQLTTWAKVQTQVLAANSTMSSMGVSIGSLTQRIAALRAQKEWIPAKNKEAIRATNLEIKKLESEINKLNNLNGGKLSKWFSDLKNTMPFQMLTNPIVLATTGIAKISQMMKEGSEKAITLHKAQAQLANTMQNMGTYSDDAYRKALKGAGDMAKGVLFGRSEIIELQSQLRMVGNIGEDEMKKLTMASADMATKFGTGLTEAGNAIAKAVNNPEMMKRLAMQLKIDPGTVGKIQKIAKKGNDAAARLMLIDVVQQKIGGSASAAFDADPMAKYNKALGSLTMRFGEIFLNTRSALLPVKMFFVHTGEGIASLFETIQKHKTLFTVLATGIGIVATAIFLYTERQKLSNIWNKITAAWTAVTTAVKTGEAAAWWAATVPMLITVGIITAIIAATVALIAAIVYCVKHVTGWGETWDNIMTFMKLGIELFEEKIFLKWLKIKNTFLSGFEVIEKAWYKLQSLWDKDGAQNALAKIEGAHNERIKEITEAREKVGALKKQMMDMTVFALKTDGTSLSDFIRIGTGINGMLQGAVNEGDTKGESPSGSTNNNIATGGTRSTIINIRIGKFFDNMVFNGGFSENVKDIERKIEEVILRVLYAAQNAG